MAGTRLPVPEAAAELPGAAADNAAFAASLPAYAVLVRSCWAQDPAERPAFEHVIKQLR